MIHHGNPLQRTSIIKDLISLAEKDSRSALQMLNEGVIDLLIALFQEDNITSAHAEASSLCFCLCNVVTSDPDFDRSRASLLLSVLLKNTTSLDSTICTCAWESLCALMEISFYAENLLCEMGFYTHLENYFIQRYYNMDVSDLIKSQASELKSMMTLLKYAMQRHKVRVNATIQKEEERRRKQLEGIYYPTKAMQQETDAEKLQWMLMWRMEQDKAGLITLEPLFRRWKMHAGTAESPLLNDIREIHENITEMGRVSVPKMNPDCRVLMTCSTNWDKNGRDSTMNSSEKEAKGMRRASNSGLREEKSEDIDEEEELLRSNVSSEDDGLKLLWWWQAGHVPVEQRHWWSWSTQLCGGFTVPERCEMLHRFYRHLFQFSTPQFKEPVVYFPFQDSSERLFASDSSVSSDSSEDSEEQLQPSFPASSVTLPSGITLPPPPPPPPLSLFAQKDKQLQEAKEEVDLEALQELCQLNSPVTNGDDQTLFMSGVSPSPFSFSASALMSSVGSISDLDITPATASLCLGASNAQADVGFRAVNETAAKLSSDSKVNQELLSKLSKNMQLPNIKGTSLASDPSLSSTQPQNASGAASGASSLGSPFAASSQSQSLQEMKTRLSSLAEGTKSSTSRSDGKKRSREADELKAVHLLALATERMKRARLEKAAGSSSQKPLDGLDGQDFIQPPYEQTNIDSIDNNLSLSSQPRANSESTKSQPFLSPQSTQIPAEQMNLSSDSPSSTSLFSSTLTRQMLQQRNASRFDEIFSDLEWIQLLAHIEDFDYRSFDPLQAVLALQEAASEEVIVEVASVLISVIVAAHTRFMASSLQSGKDDKASNLSSSSEGSFIESTANTFPSNYPDSIALTNKLLQRGLGNVCSKHLRQLIALHNDSWEYSEAEDDSNSEAEESDCGSKKKELLEQDLFYRVVMKRDVILGASMAIIQLVRVVCFVNPMAVFSFFEQNVVPPVIQFCCFLPNSLMNHSISSVIRALCTPPALPDSVFIDEKSKKSLSSSESLNHQISSESPSAVANTTQKTAENQSAKKSSASSSSSSSSLSEPEASLPFYQQSNQNGWEMFSLHHVMSGILPLLLRLLSHPDEAVVNDAASSLYSIACDGRLKGKQHKDDWNEYTGKIRQSIVVTPTASIVRPDSSWWNTAYALIAKGDYNTTPKNLVYEPGSNLYLEALEKEDGMYALLSVFHKSRLSAATRSMAATAIIAFCGSTCICRPTMDLFAANAALHKQLAREEGIDVEEEEEDEEEEREEEEADEEGIKVSSVSKNSGTKIVSARKRYGELSVVDSIQLSVTALLAFASDAIALLSEKASPLTLDDCIALMNNTRNLELLIASGLFQKLESQF
eukprot:MONOS_7903.1-p1 / transcript=MONOS_7903.1 / gene=MONOS_7903 / organism=Monocercomonoides_exilis_PA203 / gene_product=Rubrerythrin / transcript_product=Rubrerythrin / location=Mono_scaffold00283:39910-44314(+) / protein_length=1349 / sequence_SO=supercontig / SO=protein_coding / is_pseudo=false